MDMNEAIDKIKNEEPIDIFYRVSESIVGINKNSEKIKSFHWDEDFKSKNRTQSRREAIKYYGDRLMRFRQEGITKDFFDLKYSSPEDFIAGKNYAYSLNLSVVAVYGADDYHEYYLIGSDEDEMAEGKSFELNFYQNSGFSKEQIHELEGELHYEQALIEEVRKLSTVYEQFKNLSIEDIIKWIFDNITNNYRFTNYIGNRIKGFKL